MAVRTMGAGDDDGRPREWTTLDGDTKDGTENEDEDVAQTCDDGAMVPQNPAPATALNTMLGGTCVAFAARLFQSSRSRL